MDTDTQQLIIRILGVLAGIGLLEVGILTAYTTISETIATQIILISSNIVGGLVGFVAGKTLTEKQGEILEEGFGDDVQ